MKKEKIVLKSSLNNYLADISQEMDQISDERKATLLELTSFVRDAIQNQQTADIIFICTHNSRRSHFGQVWAQAIAAHFGYDLVKTYSGGTEATAFNPNAIQALEEAGFDVHALSDPPNPHYWVYYAESSYTEAFSKVYSDAANPQNGFCAIMTCNEADEACPIVFGAAKRIALPFIDPKVSDGTPEQAATYALRCRQIAREMYFVFKEV